MGPLVPLVFLNTRDSLLSPLPPLLASCLPLRCRLAAMPPPVPTSLARPPQQRHPAPPLSQRPPRPPQQRPPRPPQQRRPRPPQQRRPRPPQQRRPTLVASQ